MPMKSGLLSAILVTLLLSGTGKAQVVTMPTQEQETLWEANRASRINNSLDDFEAHNKLQLARNNPSLFSLLALTEETPRTFEFLGLVNLQHKELARLRDEYNRSIETISDDRSLSEQQRRNRIGMARIETGNKIAEVLLPKQLLQLDRLDIRRGIPKLLVNTEIGDVLLLSERQKEAIKSKSDKLAMEIEKMIEDYRQEAADIVFDELTIEQEKGLEDIFTRKRLRTYFQRIPITTMYGHFLFETPKNNQTPAMSLYETELNLGDYTQTDR